MKKLKHIARDLILISAGLSLVLIAALPASAEQNSLPSSARLTVAQQASTNNGQMSQPGRVNSDTVNNDETADQASGQQPAQNHAWLDSVQYHNGQMTVSGWHAATAAETKPNHYLILLSDGQEVARQEVTNSARPDVAQVYPTINNAGDSGWQGVFTLTPSMLGQRLQLVSRYTASQDGNSDYVDYWFNSWQLPAANQNQAFLDSTNLSDGNVRVSGWNANDYSLAAPYHFLIIFDRTANSQVASTQVTNTARPDVARAFPGITTAGHSGFSANFGRLTLEPTHRYDLVSRYSTSSTGNGGDGQYRDYWLNLGDLNQSAYWIDYFGRSHDHLHVSGWVASNWRMTRPYAYLIVLNNGHEVGRTKLNLTARPDVGRVYPAIYQSSESGFSLDLPGTIQQLTGKLTLILRFTDDPAGNGHFFDQSRQYTTDVGWFDQLQVVGNTIQVAGWHAAFSASDKPVHLLIVIGPSGTELYRTQLTGNQTNIVRNDVAKAYPEIPGADKSGFQCSVPVNLATNHTTIRVISRYATSLAEDNNPADYVDYQSGALDVSVPSNDHWISTNHGEYYVVNGHNLTGKQLISGYEYTFDQSGRQLGFVPRMVNWFRSREGKLTYSMRGSRTGADGTADCSGAITQAIQDSGGTPYGEVYDTESIAPYLKQNGYYVASSGWQFQPVQYGDIVIWGISGHSANGAGHMVLVSNHAQNPNCISAQWTITHGDPGTAVYEGSYYGYWVSHGRMYATVYRISDPGRA